MNGAKFRAHSVHLYEQGRHVKTLPDSFTADGAAAYVKAYNDIGRRDGRSAVTTCQEVEAHLPCVLQHQH